MNMTTNTLNQATEPALMYSFFANSQPVAGLSVHFHCLEQQLISLVDLERVEYLLDNGAERLTTRILSQAEQQYFKRFSYMKRRREWLGGRLAAKAVLLFQQESGQQETAMGQLTILPDSHGRPVVDRGSLGAGTVPAISISHSNRFAVALTAPGQACGVDLQESSPKLPGLIDRFTSAQEMKLVADVQADELTGLTMLWSAKEAVKKSILHDQPSVFSRIRVEQVKAVTDHCRQLYCTVQGQPQQIVTVYTCSPYVLALTMANHHA
jgi:phosphopantetheinyl transferase